MPSAPIAVRTARGEEQLDLEEFELRVGRGDIAPQCPVLFPVVTGDRWVPAGSLEIFRNRYSARRLHFSNAFRLGGFPRVTLGFIALCLVWYAAMHLWPRQNTEDTLLAYGAKAGPLLLDVGQYWRLVTANLVHKDALHIAVNLFVLFNFAGALENAYRPLDMLLILASAALGTTLLSFAVIDPLSAGASGVAYGALGAAMVFGFKYRDILPSKYRRLLGGAIVPTLLVFLFVGWTSNGVDNWGHLGGLLGGCLCTALLRPRLLTDRPSPFQRAWSRLIPLAAVTLVLIGFGPLTQRWVPRLVPQQDDELGFRLAVPSEWEQGDTRLGGVTYSNGLPGYGHAHLAIAGQLEEQPPDLQARIAEMTRQELLGPEADQRLRVNSLGTVEPAVLAGLHGLSRNAVFESEGNVFEWRGLVLQRGRLCYFLEEVWPKELPAYAGFMARLQARFEPIEPAFVQKARAKRQLAPDSEAARQDLEEALRSVGEMPPATKLRWE